MAGQLIVKFLLYYITDLKLSYMYMYGWYCWLS